MNRRDFIRTTALTGIAASYGTQTRSFAQSRSPNRKMTKHLVCGALGIKADQLRSIELAHQFGFESVEAQPQHLAKLNRAEMNALNGDLAAKKLVWGNAGLPVDFRKDEQTFKTGLKELPELAAGLQRAGVKRVSTWLMPSHDELTYTQNFKQHTTRLRQVAKILADHGLRLGFEYVGTTTLLIRGKYPFLHTMAETRELNNAIGTGNTGYVLDSWHWWQAGDSAEDIEKLNPKDVALVDLNDAPLGVAKQAQQDGQRELPMATGVIDIEPFMKALKKIDYDGPVRAEPFNQPLRDMDDEPACRATIASLDKAFKWID